MSVFPARLRISRVARAMVLVLAALLFHSCRPPAESRQNAAPVAVPAAATPGRPQATPIPYAFAELIDCRSDEDSEPAFRAAATFDATLTRSPATGDTQGYSFDVAGAAMLPAGQEKPYVLCSSPGSLSLKATRQVSSGQIDSPIPAIAALGRVTKQLLDSSEQDPAARHGSRPVHFFPPNHGGLPTSIDARFDIDDVTVPALGAVRVIACESLPCRVPVSLRSGAAATLSFHALVVLDPADKTLHYSAWSFQADYDDPDEGIVHFTHRILVSRTDAAADHIGAALQQTGREPPAVPAAAASVPDHGSSDQLPPAGSISLWLSRLAYLSVGVQAERDTNPGAILALLGAAAVADWVFDWGSNIYSDIQHGRQINVLDDDGYSYITAGVRAVTDPAGIPPEYGDLIASGVKILMSAGADKRLGIDLAPKLSLVAGGHMARAGTVLKHTLRTGLDFVKTTRELREAAGLTELVKNAAEIVAKPPTVLPTTPAAPPMIRPADVSTVPTARSPRSRASTPTNTRTVFVTDVSGSMDADSGGRSKLEAAVAAATDAVEFVRHQTAAGLGTHSVAVVGFANDAELLLEQTTNWQAVGNSLQRLRAFGRTNLGAGLAEALRSLGATPPDTLDIVVLLTDGLANRGMGPEEILAGPAAQAARAGIPVFTVGFGGDQAVDADLLRRIASDTGGEYASASTPMALRNLYVRLRHQALGNTVLDSGGMISQGQKAPLGSFQVTKGSGVLNATVQWPGSDLDMLLYDPLGRLVDAAYSGARFAKSKGFLSLIVIDPKPGTWTAYAFGKEVPEGVMPYQAFVSCRPPAQTPRPAPNAGPILAVVLLLLLAAALGVACVLAFVLLNVDRSGSGETMSPGAAHGGPVAPPLVLLEPDGTRYEFSASAACTVGNTQNCDLFLPALRNQSPSQFLLRTNPDGSCVIDRCHGVVVRPLEPEGTGQAYHPSGTRIHHPASVEMVGGYVLRILPGSAASQTELQQSASDHT